MKASDIKTNELILWYGLGKEFSVLPYGRCLLDQPQYIIEAFSWILTCKNQKQEMELRKVGA